MNEEKLSVRLNCPIPKLDFDVITLGHGSGGLLMHRLLDEGIFKALDNPWLENPHDGAVFELAGPLAFSTDSFVVSPLFFPGGNIGDLAVNGTVNDLAMCGAVPKYLSLGFIIEEGFHKDDFWEILLSIREACKEAGVSVITGDTKVVEKGKGDGIFINTTGIGTVHPKAMIGATNIQPGDKILVSGPVASHGMAIMSKREGLAFESDIISDTRSVNDLVIDLIDTFGESIRFLRDPTRGGLASSLNEVAAGTKAGVQIEANSLPVLEPVESACEILGLDPLYVANEGIFMAIVAKDKAAKILDRIQTHPKGQGAAIIGEITAEHPKRVVQISPIGGKRIVNMLAGEQLPRIC